MASDKDIAETALKRFKYVSETWAPQRKREQEDLRFLQDPWSEQAKAERAGQMVGGKPVPPRPMLTIDKLGQPRQLIQNQFRQARLGINLHPTGVKANPETAQAIQGLYRSIEQMSHADQARGWAFSRARDAGMGFYRITTDYDDESGHPFDQVIKIDRILYQSSVYLDPAAQKPDFRDGMFAFIVAWLPIDRFKALYPGADLPGESEAMQFSAMAEITPDWVRQDGAGKAIMVAEYWYKRYEKQTMVLLEDGSTVIKEEQPKGWKAPEGAPTRDHEVTQVWYCKLAPGGDPLQHLEGPREIEGQYIPIVPVIAEEINPYDEKRCWQGIVRPNRDAVRSYNYAASTLIERMALEPKVPFIGVEGQFEGHEDEWGQANTRNFGTIEYKPVTIAGTPAGPPQRAQIDSSGASLAVLGLQQFNDFIQSGTFAYDPSLGQSQPQRSGKAIMAEQQQFESSSSGYLYNLADVSMPYEALIVLDLIPHVYNRPGRVVQILDGEGNTEQVMLNTPFMQDQEGVPMEMSPGMPAPQGAEVKEYNLTEGVYSVDVTVGKSFQSLRQEGQQVIGEILQSHPEMLPILGPLWAQMSDFPGSQEFKDLLIQLRAMQFPNLGQPGSPEQMQAENAQLKQQMQQLQQQMQQATQMIQTKQVEQQGAMQKAQLDSQTKLQTTQMDNEAKIAIAMLEGRLAQVEAALKAEHEKDKVKLQAHADVAKQAAGVALQPPDLTFKQSAKQPLPGREQF